MKKMIKLRIWANGDFWACVVPHVLPQVSTCTRIGTKSGLEVEAIFVPVCNQFVSNDTKSMLKHAIGIKNASGSNHIDE